MNHESKRNRVQSIAMILLIASSTMSVFFRIRKMMHYSMIGEETTGFDWYMIVLGLIVISVASYTLISRNEKGNITR